MSYKPIGSADDFNVVFLACARWRGWRRDRQSVDNAHRCNVKNDSWPRGFHESRTAISVRAFFFPPLTLVVIEL